jgi:predicted kinase
MASGKSTVAQRLAERLPRCVHLRGDVFRRMIVSGRAEMDFELSEEALAQLRLRYRIAAEVARMYLDAGFSVVYQDIVIGSALADVMRQLPRELLHVVVLCPSVEAVAAREAVRAKSGYADSAAVLSFDRALRAGTPRVGLWVDSSALTVEETVDLILGRLDEAAIAPA